jgi:phosphate transport system substrate-binding protein
MRTKTRRVMLTALLGLAIVWGMPRGVLAKGLIYEGSATIGETVMPEAAKAFETKTGVKFDKMGTTGSSDGFKAVMAGQAAIAGVSRALKRDEKELKPYYQIIGYDGNAVYLHEKNPVQNLSREQLKGIYTGKITNWQEVGGNDAPITVVIANRAHGTVQDFQRAVLDGAEFKPTKEFPQQTDCLKYVATDEHAITNAPMAFKMSRTKIIGIDKHYPSPESVKSGDYPLSRPLLLVAKGLPQGDVKKFFAFMLSVEGQKIVARYYVPVK